jgi:hypothetical protein
MLSSIKQVKVGRGIPMLCIRSIVHYINIYSRIVIQLNMYVKIITSSGFKSTILTDFVQGQLRVPFRFGRCLKFPGSTLIYRKLSSPPQALRLRAQLDTRWKKIGAEFMTSVSYRPEVIICTLSVNMWLAYFIKPRQSSGFVNSNCYSKLIIIIEYLTKLKEKYARRSNIFLTFYKVQAMAFLVNFK